MIVRSLHDAGDARDARFAFFRILQARVCWFLRDALLYDPNYCIRLPLRPHGWSTSFTGSSKCRSRPPLSLGMMPLLWASLLTKRTVSKISRSRWHPRHRMRSTGIPGDPTRVRVRMDLTSMQAADKSESSAHRRQCARPRFVLGWVCTTTRIPHPAWHHISGITEATFVCH